MINTNTDMKVGAVSLTSQRQCGAAALVASSVSGSVLSRFARAEGGNVAMLFSLMSVVVVSMVGAAVDYGRWLNAHNQTQNALDSAVLAAGRTLQTTNGNATQSVAAANSYYAEMKSRIATSDTVSFVSTKSNTTIEARGNAYIKTPFLSIIGIDRLPLMYDAQSKQAEATIAQGGNNGSSIEIGLMLDTTGSMSGQKLVDLKLAAKDLVDIVVWDDQSNYTSRIALAPFANTVNVGDHFQAVTGLSAAALSHTETVQTGSTPIYTYPASCYNNKGVLKNSCKNKPQYITGSTPIYETVTIVDSVAKAKCVVERTGTNEFTGVVPAAGAWINSWNVVTGSTSTTCPESSPIVPLTSDKTLLKNTIDGMVASGATAGALGTAWAWYLIEPDWGTIFTGSSKPDTYAKMTQLGEQGQPLLQKIAILMTDGAYNTHQAVQNGDTSSAAIAIRAKAVSLCTAMKAKGIKVYTVGFQIGSNTDVVNTLSSCATDPTYFYNASSGEALRTAFRDIALKISNLRLSY